MRELLSPWYEIPIDVLSYISYFKSYEIAIVAISYGRISKSSVRGDMVLKIIWGHPSTPSHY